MRAREGVAGYLSEYSRLSGAGPSLLEVTSRDAMLEVLSRAFSTPVQSADVKFLRYRKVGKGVELEDMAGRLGGILTSVEPRDADPKALLAYLKKHGAKTFKAESLEETLEMPPALPKDLRKAKPAQLKKAVAYLAKKPLRELRRMQDIVRKQIPVAFKKRDDQALGNLQIMDTLLASAVDKREFGESLEEGDQIGKTIIQQMGGPGAIQAMLGGSYTFLPKGVGMRWPNKKRTKGNYVEVILTPADLYDVTFYNMKGTMQYWHPDAPKKQVKQYKGVMFDQLREIFYRQTGWILSKPRVRAVVSSPGRDERIAKARAELRAKWKKAGLL